MSNISGYCSQSYQPDFTCEEKDRHNLVIEALQYTLDSPKDLVLTCEEEIDYEAIEADSTEPVTTGSKVSISDGDSGGHSDSNMGTSDEEEEECAGGITDMFNSGSDRAEETVDRSSDDRRTTTDGAGEQVNTRAEEIGLLVRPPIRKDGITREDKKERRSSERDIDGSGRMARRSDSPGSINDQQFGVRRTGDPETGMEMETETHEERVDGSTNSDDEYSPSDTQSKILVDIVISSNSTTYNWVKNKCSDLLKEIRATVGQSVTSMECFNVDEADENRKKIHEIKKRITRQRALEIMEEKGLSRKEALELVGTRGEETAYFYVNPDGTQCRVGCQCSKWHGEPTKENEERIRRFMLQSIENAIIRKGKMISCPMCHWIIKDRTSFYDLSIKGERQKRRTERYQYWRTWDTEDGHYYVLFDSLSNPVVWIPRDEPDIETADVHVKKFRRQHQTWEEVEGARGQHSIVLYDMDGKRKAYVHCLCCPDKSCKVDTSVLRDTELHWAELTVALDRLDTNRPSADSERSRICCKWTDDELITARNVREQERHPERWIQLCCRWIRRSDVSDNSEDESPIASDDEAVMAILDSNEYQKESLEELTRKSKNLEISPKDQTDGTTTAFGEKCASTGLQFKRKERSRTVGDHVEKKKIIRDKKLRRSQRLMQRELDYMMDKTQRLKYEDTQETLTRQRKVFAKVSQLRKRKEEAESLQATVDSLIQTNKQHMNQLAKIREKCKELDIPIPD